MLQTVREYALARLAETGGQASAGRRHLAHYLTVARAARPELDGPRQAEFLDRLETAYPNCGPRWNSPGTRPARIMRA